MEQDNEHRTDRDLLMKGLQNLGISFLLMFIGPTLLFIAFTNEDIPTYPLLLAGSLIICALAVYFLYRGLKIVVQGIFNDDKKNNRL